jgi:hypothetical protein
VIAVWVSALISFDLSALISLISFSFFSGTKQYKRFNTIRDYGEGNVDINVVYVYWTSREGVSLLQSSPKSGSTTDIS